MVKMSAGRNINSQNKEWNTPHKYVVAISDFFDGEIDLDPCSNRYSLIDAKKRYILPQDGLLESWDYDKIYVNPPYGSDKTRKTSIKCWLRKCSEAHENHQSEVLALVPVATNTGHWKKYIFNKAKAICFLYDTRLKFLINGQEGGKGAPMACCMVYWGNNFLKFKNIFSKFGFCVDIVIS